MPFSHSTQISAIVGFIEQLQPQSILDVGVGMGQYGFLARTNLENVNLFVVDGAKAVQSAKSDWKVRIDGIEAFKTYRTPVHDYAYNDIYWDDTQKILPTLPDNQYALVIAIDILEHFDVEDGIKFLAQLKRIAEKDVLVSTPKTFIHQEVEANPYENHRSLWSQKQLEDQGFSQIIKNDESWIAVCSTEEKNK
jgi:cyclopropane fatty-acyl-phospholipid synthase-like methyltransferase